MTFLQVEGLLGGLPGVVELDRVLRRARRLGRPQVDVVDGHLARRHHRQLLDERAGGGGARRGGAHRGGACEGKDLQGWA